MANKLRSVNTKFWDDTFTSELTPTEKLLFLYLITNPLTKLIGIYEISLKRICFDTGMNLKMVQDGLKRFEKVRKAFFIDNYIILPNWLKHQNLNTNMKKAVIKEFAALPKSLRDTILVNDDETVSNDYETILNHLQTVRKEEVEEEDESKYKKQKPEEFYKIQLELSENNSDYKLFMSWLFGDNIFKRPLHKVLGMSEQVSWDQFPNLIQIHNDTGVKIKPLLEELENWLMKKPSAKNSTVIGTLRTFVNNKNKK